MADSIPGPVPAVVARVEDETRCRRVTAFVDGVFEPETPYWCQPAGWPGAGGELRGSMYPVQPGDQIYLLFLYGDPDAGALYLPGPYGLSSQGLMAGPERVHQATTNAEANKDVILWEDDTFLIGILYSDGKKRLQLLDKRTSSGIVLDAADGPSGGSTTLLLQGFTAMQLSSLGVVDIYGSVVQVQKRRVQRVPSKPI